MTYEKYGEELQKPAKAMDGNVCQTYTNVRVSPNCPNNELCSGTGNDLIEARRRIRNRYREMAIDAKVMLSRTYVLMYPGSIEMIFVTTT